MKSKLNFAVCAVAAILFLFTMAPQPAAANSTPPTCQQQALDSLQAVVAGANAKAETTKVVAACDSNISVPDTGACISSIDAAVVYYRAGGSEAIAVNMIVVGCSGLNLCESFFQSCPGPILQNCPPGTVGKVVAGVPVCAVPHVPCLLNCVSPLSAEAHSTPEIGPSHADSGPTCTGTHHAIQTGTVGGTVGGGEVISASVSASLSMETKTEYDFGCDYSMWVSGWGRLGVERVVHNAVMVASNLVPVPGDCQYDGVTTTSCTTNPVPFLSDAFAGTGVAGPGWPLPTSVTICPPDNYQSVTYNDNLQDFGAGSVDAEAWHCQNFAIHYTI